MFPSYHSSFYLSFYFSIVIKYCIWYVWCTIKSCFVVNKNLVLGADGPKLSRKWLQIGPIGPDWLQDTCDQKLQLSKKYYWFFHRDHSQINVSKFRELTLILKTFCRPATQTFKGRLQLIPQAPRKIVIESWNTRKCWLCGFLKVLAKCMNDIK